MKRVGLLGGSFNPAHDGHVHISLLALEHLALDAIWWLVSPQNPLKPVEGMASFEERFASAEEKAASEERIIVSDAEKRLGTYYTAETLPLLLKEYADMRFLWVMGADILPEMERWEKWTSIFDTLPIAIFARPPYDSSVLDSKAAQRFQDNRLSEAAGKSLIDTDPPAWIYFDTPLNPESATQIRTRRSPENAPG